MATYAIGDIQGCRAPFEALLEEIAFDPDRDRLLLAGDLVNRGHDSLGTLRLIYRHRHAITTVLGNHDLHLLAVAYGTVVPRGKDTIADIVEADDGAEMIEWLRHQPLLAEAPEFNAVMTHAGIPPMWDINKARALAREAGEMLQSARHKEFFDNMYGDFPDCWHEELGGFERLRVIINYYTRMRFLDPEGRLDLKTKGGAADAPPGYKPWYEYPERKTRDKLVLFGHWAALDGKTAVDNVEALDTGCVWGNSLTALRLDDMRRFGVSCAGK